MFGANPFGVAPFGDVGNRDTLLTVNMSVTDALDANLTTAILFNSSASVIDAVTSSSPVTYIRLTALPRSADQMNIYYGECFIAFSLVEDACSATPITNILMESEAYSEDSDISALVDTLIQMAANASAIDISTAKFNLFSHSSGIDSSDLNLTTQIILNSDTAILETVTAVITTDLLLASSLECLDIMDIVHLSFGHIVYPLVNRWSRYVEARDYSIIHMESDYKIPSLFRDFSIVSATKDYNVYHDSIGLPMTIKTLSTKDPGETVPVKFFFDNMVASLDEASTVEVTLSTGTTDPQMSTMLVGDPVVADALVVQLVRGGLAGNSYKIKCTASLGTEVYISTAILPIEVE